MATTTSTTGNSNSSSEVVGDGIPSVAVVTSRLRRLVAPDEPWVAGLRAVQRAIQANQWQLLIGDGTAGSDFIRHAAIRLRLCHKIISPPASDESPDGPPVQDRVLVDAAQTVYVLALRTGGNLHYLLRERLQQQLGRVILIDLPGLQSNAARTELCLLGATTWQPSSDECRPFESSSQSSTEASNSSGEVFCVAPLPTSLDWQFLTHTTRSCPGPWPNETFATYADDLFESRPTADHSVVGTLQRILAQQRLIASGRTIRGSHRVVSFTACPLSDLPSLHRYRNHRTHWDFEPFGLCIRRDSLIRGGARPVIYGSEADWTNLSEVDRPFFQLAIGDSGIDWKVEREWRVLGDLNLDSLTPDDALLFVPDADSARKVAKLSPWPVTLWPGTVDAVD